MCFFGVSFKSFFFLFLVCAKQKTLRCKHFHDRSRTKSAGALAREKHDDVNGDRVLCTLVQTLGTIANAI